MSVVGLHLLNEGGGIFGVLLNCLPGCLVARVDQFEVRLVDPDGFCGFVLLLHHFEFFEVEAKDDELVFN